jgi:hypothetical protein
MKSEAFSFLTKHIQGSSKFRTLLAGVHGEVEERCEQKNRQTYCTDIEQ